MKTLYLFRHAKSSWDDARLADFDRPLNERGKVAAALMGKIMRQRNVSPDNVICSPAKRTRKTLKAAFESAGLKVEVKFEEGVYLSSAEKLLDLLADLNDSLASVMLVGHNPGLEDLLEGLTGRYERFPTATLTELELDIDRWRSLELGCGRIVWLVRPKELRQNDCD